MVLFFISYFFSSRKLYDSWNFTKKYRLRPEKINSILIIFNWDSEKN